MAVPYIITRAGLTVVLATGPRSIAAEDPAYGEVKELLRTGAATPEAIQEVLERGQREMEASLEAIGESGVAIRKDGLVTLGGQVIDNSLTRRMLVMREEGFDLSPMANFLVRLQANPSYRARQELYTFLEVGQLPLTPDGCFLAYKIVRSDYKDYHSGTFDNSVGQVLTMPRSAVDDDCNRTCSAGLHFCSLSYLSCFGGSDGHVMILKIDPADVVSIPADYNNTKGRCCRYEVIGEYTEYRRGSPQPLFQSSVCTFFELEAESEAESEVEVALYYIQVMTPDGLEVEDEDLEIGEALRRVDDLQGQSSHGYLRNEADEIVKVF